MISSPDPILCIGFLRRPGSVGENRPPGAARSMFSFWSDVTWLSSSYSQGWQPLLFGQCCLDSRCCLSVTGRRPPDQHVHQFGHVDDTTLSIVTCRTSVSAWNMAERRGYPCVELGVSAGTMLGLQCTPIGDSLSVFFDHAHAQQVRTGNCRLEKAKLMSTLGEGIIVGSLFVLARNIHACLQY